VSRASEPGLLLTPPDEASETDVGRLSASEIATSNSMPIGSSSQQTQGLQWFDRSDGLPADRFRFPPAAAALPRAAKCRSWPSGRFQTNAPAVSIQRVQSGWRSHSHSAERPSEIRERSDESVDYCADDPDVIDAQPKF
jgi:hypothetical protein